MTIRNQIVCADDFERRGKQLDGGNVLGLISFLREERGCKIALILNHEKLTEWDTIPSNQGLGGNFNSARRREMASPVSEAALHSLNA